MPWHDHPTFLSEHFWTSQVCRTAYGPWGRSAGRTKETKPSYIINDIQPLRMYTMLRNPINDILAPCITQAPLCTWKPGNCSAVSLPVVVTYECVIHTLHLRACTEFRGQHASTEVLHRAPTISIRLSCIHHAVEQTSISKLLQVPHLQGSSAQVSSSSSNIY